MNRTWQFYPSFRPVSFVKSGAALWLMFLLATHAFWCGLAGSICESDTAPGTAMSATRSFAAATTIVTHSHLGADICAGVDETKTRASASAPMVVSPVLIWIALVWVVAASVLVTLWQRAAVFGRDGPVSVPPLWGRLVRASLPHRAPPVFLF